MASTLAQAKWSYVTRRLGDPWSYRLGPISSQPQLGDLVVGKVVGIGNHTHIEDPQGRRRRLYPGDLVVGAYGNRYASDYYEGYLAPGVVTHLLAAGGVVGTVASTHARYADPTVLEVAGSLADKEGTPLSLDDFCRPMVKATAPRLGTLVVVGSSMNAGKTTTASSIARGWMLAGLNAGAGKITGSGSGKDRWSYVDAGATQVCDFLDFGMSSTFGYPMARLHRTMTAIRDALVNDGADATVLEIADGLFQSETRALVASLGGFADGMILAVADPLAARAGADVLRRLDLPLRAISGLITTSPLAAREAAAVTGLPVLSPAALAQGAAVELLGDAAEVA